MAGEDYFLQPQASAGTNILAALQASRTSPLETNYGIAGGALAQAIPSLTNPYASAGSNLGMVGGASILAALLGNYARDEAGSINAASLPLQQEYINPQTSAARKAELLASYPRIINPIATAQLKESLDLQSAKALEEQKLALGEPYDIRKEQRSLGTDTQKQINSAYVDLNKNLGRIPAPTTADPNATEQIYDPIEREVEKSKRLAEAVKEIENKGDPLAALPKSIRADAKEEIGTLQKKEQVVSYVNDAFDRAKTLVGDNAYYDGSFSGRPTEEGAALSGLKEGIAFQLDNMIGKEVNSDARLRIINSMTPRWDDTTEILDSKKEAFNKFASTFSKPTPILDALKSTPKVEDLPQPPDGYELTGNKDANGNYGIRPIR